MRILNVTQTYFPFMEFGGPPVKIPALSEALVRRGHQVTVLTADWGLESRMSGTKGSAKRGVFGWELKRNGVTAIYLPAWLHYRATAWGPHVGGYCREQVQNFDVVHIFGLYDFLGPAVARTCRKRGVPYVVEPIGMLLPIVRNFKMKQMYHLLLGRAMLAGCSRLIATSGQELEEFVSAGVSREKIVLRRNGVEAPVQLPERGKFRAGLHIGSDIKLILFLGRLSQKKSPDLLLQAFAKLSRQLDKSKLLLVFAGPDDASMKSKLRRTASELGVDSMVRFCGPLFGDEKWAAYRDADIFVLPSVNENFGNAAGEAAAAGTPVIVTDQCGIAPLLAGVAGVVVPHDAEAIEKAIERMLEDASLYDRLSAGCRQISARLNWEQPALEMENLYAQLAPESSRH